MIITCPRCTARYVVDPDHFGLGARMSRCSNCGHQWRAEPGEDDDLQHALPGGSIVPPQPIAVDAEDERQDDDRDHTDAADHGAGWPDEDDSEPPRWPLPASGVDRDEEVSPVSSDNGDPDAADDDGVLDLTLAGDEDDEVVDETVVEPEPLPVPPSPVSVATAAAVDKLRARRRLLIAGGAAAATLLLCLGGLAALQEPLTRAIPGMAALYHIVGLAPAPPGADLDIAEVTSSREWADNEDLLLITGTVTNTADEARPMPPLRVTLYDAADREVQETIVEPEKPVLAPGEKVRFNARIANPASTARRMVVSFDTTVAGNS